MALSGEPSFIKDVPSPIAPLNAAALPNNCSKFCAIVIRDGIACGFIIMSGTIPDSVRGISYPLSNAPIVPFWPWRFELPVHSGSLPIYLTKNTSDGIVIQYTLHTLLNLLNTSNISIVFSSPI